MAGPIMDLAGRRVLITGASSGLGRAIAAASAAAGAKLVLLGRNAQRLEETRALCPTGEHVVHVADLTDLDAVPALIGQLCREGGPLAGLVHCAGLHQPVPLRAIRAKHLSSLFEVNAAAAVMAVKGLSLKGNYAPGASVVLLSSVLGRRGQTGTIGYCMSKGALEQACRALALELAGQGIRVNCLAPAVIKTPMSEAFFHTIGEVQAEKIRRQHPSGLGQPEDVANAAVYLLSDASRYITGASLPVDGGYCAQ